MARNKDKSKKLPHHHHLFTGSTSSLHSGLLYLLPLSTAGMENMGWGQPQQVLSADPSSSHFPLLQIIFIARDPSFLIRNDFESCSSVRNKMQLIPQSLYYSKIWQTDFNVSCMQARTSHFWETEARKILWKPGCHATVLELWNYYMGIYIAEIQHIPKLCNF